MLTSRVYYVSQRSPNETFVLIIKFIIISLHYFYVPFLVFANLITFLECVHESKSPS